MFLVNTIIIKTKSIGWHDCNVLIAGDSHPEKALIPKFFFSAINISQDAEPYYVTYWKLQKYLSRNTTDTLLLGFSFHNLSSFNDKKLTDKYWSDEMFKRIYSIKDLSSVHDIEIDKNEFNKIRFKNMCLYPCFQPFNFIGGYSNSNYSNLSEPDTVIKRHYFYNGNETQVSDISIKYLDSIISLCKEKNIRLIAICTPMHYSYINKIPEKFKSSYELEKEKLKKDGVVVLDFSQQNYKDDFYLNPDHLNKKGAENFSAQIAKILTNKSTLY